MGFEGTSAAAKQAGPQESIRTDEETHLIAPMELEIDPSGENWHRRGIQAILLH